MGALRGVAHAGLRLYSDEEPARVLFSHQAGQALSIDTARAIQIINREPPWEPHNHLCRGVWLFCV